MGAHTGSAEHRWGTRVTLDIPAEVARPGGFAVSGTVTNVSVSGAFVVTRAKFPLLSRVSIHPLGNDGEWLEACVVRAEGRGIAVQWLEPAVRTVSGLLSLPQRRAAQ